MSDITSKDKDEKDNKQKDTLINAGLAGALSEKVQRYGSGVKEHLVAHNGVDNETGKIFKRSLKSISKSKIHPEHKPANLRQQAGFSAEVKTTARSNAEKIIKGEKTRTTRTDDIGRVNDPLFDLVELDEKGNIIPGSGTQMKFVGKTPEKAFSKLMSPECQKYIDANISFEVPSDYYDDIKKAANKKIAELQEQVEALEAQGKNDVAQQKRAQIRKAENIRDNLKNSGVSNADAMEARRNPILSTAKDITKVSHRAGVESAKAGAAIGGGISGIRNIIAVVKGDKKAEDALIDTAADTGKAAAVSYAVAFAGSALKGAMQNAPAKFARTLSKTNLPAIVVTVALETGKTLSKYLDGQIDGTECLEELGEKGTGMLSSAMFASQGAALGTFLIPIPGVGTVVGGLVGGMIGYSFSSAYYRQLLGALKEAKIAHEERLRIESECEEAVKAIREYRAEIESLLSEYLTEYKDSLNMALNEMRDAYATGDADSFITGANSITEKLGGKPQFETVDEFQALLKRGYVFKL